MSRNANRNAHRYITVQSLTQCQLEFKTRSHRKADTTHSSNVFQSATHIVLGALVGPALQKQPHAFSATLSGGAYQCNVSVLNMALPCIFRDDRSMQKSQPTPRHEAKMSTKQCMCLRSRGYNNTHNNINSSRQFGNARIWEQIASIFKR